MISNISKNSFNKLKPSSLYSRIESVDSLRGFALLGVLFANIPIADSNTISGNLDSIFEFITYTLIDKKFITIFSILFGFGFYIQMSKIKKVSFIKYYSVRMLLLFIIGVIHSYGVWNGDIIMSYAIAGFLLLLIKKSSIRKLILLAIIFSVLLTGIFFIINSTVIWEETYVKLASELPVTNSLKRYFYLNFKLNPWTNFFRDMPITLSFTFGNMIIGFILGKINFFSSFSLRVQRLKTNLIILGSILGFSSSFIYYLISIGDIDLNEDLIWLPFVLVTGMILQSLFYISIFLFLYEIKILKKALSLFSYIGKVALTNYIMQSIFYLVLIFHCASALQLFGKITIGQTYILAVVLFCLQILFSKLWLKKFNQGPIEYIWKKISYRMIN